MFNFKFTIFPKWESEELGTSSRLKASSVGILGLWKIVAENRISIRVRRRICRSGKLVLVFSKGCWYSTYIRMPLRGQCRVGMPIWLLLENDMWEICSWVMKASLSSFLFTSFCSVSIVLCFGECSFFGLICKRGCRVGGERRYLSGIRMDKNWAHLWNLERKSSRMPQSETLSSDDRVMVTSGIEICQFDVELGPLKFKGWGFLLEGRTKAIEYRIEY